MIIVDDGISGYDDYYVIKDVTDGTYYRWCTPYSCDSFTAFRDQAARFPDKRRAYGFINLFYSDASSDLKVIKVRRRG